MPKINLKRSKGVVATSTREQVFERYLNMNLFKEPEDEAQRDLAGDSFHDVFKYAPKLLEDVPPERAVNKAVLEWINDSGLDRSKTAGRTAASLASAAVMWAGLIQDSTIKEALEKQKQAEDAAKEAEQAEQEAADLAKQAAQQDGGMTPEQQNAMAQAAAKAAAARQKAQQAGEIAQKAVDDARGHAIKKNAAKKVAQKANEAADQVNDVMDAWGIGEGDLQQGDVENILKMASSRNIAELTRLFGRFRGDARRTIATVRSGKTGGVPEVDDTRDLNRIFMVETLKMSHHAPLPVQIQTVQQFARRGLLGFVPQEEGNESGSFIAYVDESGSIGQNLCAMEKALCLGIAHATRDEIEDKRPWEIYGFASRILEGVTDQDDWRKVVQWAANFNNGGTDISAVLRHAIDRLRVFHDSGIRDVDIVIITDGQDYLSDSILFELDQVKAELGTRLAYIHLGWGANEKIVEHSDVFIHTENVMDFGRMADDILKQVAEMIGGH